MFTDVEGSTRAWAEDPDGMSASLRVHDDILEHAIDINGGYVFSTAGDSYGAAFAQAGDALMAAHDTQSLLEKVAWPGPRLRVRIGVHIGRAEERNGNYFGPDVNMAARVEDAGHGGQILLSRAAKESSSDQATELVDLGLHHLRDVPDPVHLFQVGRSLFPALRTIEQDATNLPDRPTPVIGRDDEVAHVRSLLLLHRLVTIVGIGGIGKTRLALAIGEAELRAYGGHVRFVDLASVLSRDELPAAVAAGLGLGLEDGTDLNHVLRYLATNTVLVLLDNCEQVIDACAEFVDRVLSQRGHSRILATSRECLDLDGERVIRLPPLGTDDPDGPAVQLFLDRATGHDASFAMTAKNAAAITRICAELDGLPLAIELAAALVPVMTASEILAGLDDRFALLGHGRRRQPERTLEATLDWSYSLLTENQKEAFRSLGVFVEGFGLEALDAVVASTATPTAALLQQLVAKSLVIAVPVKTASGVTAARRFRLLETVRVYAAALLKHSGSHDLAVGALCDHVHRQTTVYKRRIVPEARHGARLKPDRGNITTAIEWAMSQANWIIAAEILLGSLNAYETSGYATEARALFLHIEDQIELADDGLARQLKAAILITLMLLDDWPLADRLANELVDKKQPSTHLVGLAFLGFTNHWTNPDTGAEMFRLADEVVSEALQTDPGSNTDLAILWLATARATLASHDNDIAVMLPLADYVVAAERSADYMTFLSFRGLAMSAAGRAVCGNPEQALVTLQQLMSLTDDEAAGEDIQVFAYLALGDIGRATEVTRHHASRAATGRLSRECSDSVVLFAALAQAEGDEETARRLLLGCGIVRQSALNIAAIDLAQRLDIARQFTKHQVDSYFLKQEDPAGVLGGTRSMAILRGELDRRGWSTVGKPLLRGRDV